MIDFFKNIIFCCHNFLLIQMAGISYQVGWLWTSLSLLNKVEIKQKMWTLSTFLNFLVILMNSL